MNKITANIPTANEAKNLIKKGQYEKAQKQMKEIEDKIKTAISKGYYAISGNGALDPFVRKILEEKGYLCSNGNQYNESYWNISWY